MTGESMPGFPWDGLGIPPTSDAREIQRAYARRLRALDIDREPAAFQALRSAYEAALAEAAAAAEKTTPQKAETAAADRSADEPPGPAAEFDAGTKARLEALLEEFAARGRNGDTSGALAAVGGFLRGEAFAFDQKAELEARLFLAVYDDPDMPVALLAGLAQRFRWNEVGSGLEQYQPHLYARYLYRLSSANAWLQWLRDRAAPRPFTGRGVLQALRSGGHVTRAGVVPSHNAWLVLRRFRPLHARMGVVPWDRDGLDKMLRDARRFGPLLGDAIDPQTVAFLWTSLKRQNVAWRGPRRYRPALYLAIGLAVPAIAWLAYFGPSLFGGNSGPPDARQALHLTQDNWVVLRRFDRKILVYFSELMSDRGVIAEIRYGIDSETPDRIFGFPAFDGPGLAPITAEVPVFVEAPAATRFVTVQLRFKDGTFSPIRRYDKIQKS
ncbi:MAG TPA: hypothetical protein VMU06_20910 [Stellaceae bacterium]|nr:hypothetical protein [Stellaceae bacterium]